MYSALGQKVEWQGQEYTIQGMSPAKYVGAGAGFAAMLIVDNRSIYINTKDLKIN